MKSLTCTFVPFPDVKLGLLREASQRRDFIRPWVFQVDLDEQIVVKELCSRWTVAEKDALMKFAPSYFKYLNQTNKNATILAKIFGFYGIKLKTPTTELNIDISVTEHLFANKDVSRKFDLKGVPDRYIPNTSPSQVLLDGDWLEGRYSLLFPLYSHSKKILTECVRNDTEFLCSQNVMDYSLVVGVDDTRKELVIGIVDFIGPWTWYKLVETTSKATIRNDRQVTVLPPDLYRDRFRKAMDENFLMVPDKWTKLDQNFDRLPHVL